MNKSRDHQDSVMTNSFAREVRHEWVDYAKCIGIFLVVYGHVSRGVYNAGIEVPPGFYQWADSVIYTFHMPLFFFLSGLFFYSSIQKKGSLKLVFSKVDTIFYPYVIWSIFQGTVEVSLSSYTNGSVLFSDVFSLLLEPRAQFWFLYSLFFIFILAAVCFFVLNRLAIILVFLISLLMHAFAESFFLSVMVNYVLDNFVFFMMGVLFSQYASVKKLVTPMSLIFCMLLFVISQYLFHSDVVINRMYVSLLEFFVVAFSLMLVVSVSYQLSLKPSKIIIFIGSYSMAIYLMHILVGGAVRILLSRLFFVESYVTHISVGVVMAIVIPLLSVLLIKKYSIPYVFSAPVSTIISSTILTPISVWLNRKNKAPSRKR